MEMVRALLEGLQDIEGPLTFWAFLSVVGLAALYFFLQSSKFHRLWSELLGRILLAEQAFRLVKYFLIGVFLLLVLIVIMAASAPLILEKMKIEPEVVQALTLASNETQESRKIFQDAMRVFKEDKDYRKSLELFRDVRAKLNSEKSRETVDGLITASYYGSGRHREGLYEICNLYKSRPQTSIRYRFDIHAHTRKIALRDGYYAAEGIATKFKTTCGRKDFSPVWAGIPLAKMEYLRHGSTVFEESFSLSNKDEEYLRKIIKHYPDDAFLDHAHYFLFQFDNVIGTNSIIEDVSIIASAQSKRNRPSAHQQYISLLRRYLEKFPQSDRYSRIEYELTSSLLASGFLSAGLVLASRQERGVDQYISQISNGFTESVRKFGLPESLTLVKEYGVSGIFSSAWDESGVWGFLSFHELRTVLDAFESVGFIHLLRPQFDDLWTKYCDVRGIQLIHSSGFRAALDLYTGQKSALSASDILVPALLETRVLDSRGLIRSNETNSSQASIKAAIYLRNFGAESLALDRFKAIADDYGNPAEAQKAMYLGGAMLRRMGDYKEARDFFYRLWESYPHSPLADDALAEVGWYHLIIRRDIDKAHNYFNEVLKTYSDSNAADNSLNWIAWSSLREGNYLEALERYVKLSTTYAGTRLGERGKKAIERLRTVVGSARIEQRLAAIRVDGNRIVGVDPGDTAVLYGDIITEVNGYSVTDESTLQSALSSVTEDTTKVKIVRGTNELELTFLFPVEEVTVYDPYPSDS